MKLRNPYLTTLIIAGAHALSLTACAGAREDASTREADSGSGGVEPSLGGASAGAPVAGLPGVGAGAKGEGGSAPVAISTAGAADAMGGGAGSAGSPSAGASGASPMSGVGGANPGLMIPPVRDAVSPVPISKASGYTVEGNYPYGPLTAQRIDVIYPPNAGPKGTQVLPAVLMFHGGGWIHSYTNDYGSGKDHMSTFFDRFLAHGFIVFNAEYRVNDGTSAGAVAPAAVQDALLAAKWCWDYLDYFHGDRSRYVVTGASAGGHLALMVGMTTPEAMLGPTSPNDFKIAAIVDGYGPADIEAEINAVANAWIPTNLPNRAAIAKQVNPMTYVRKDIPPVIDVQGSDDHTAPISDSIHLFNLLSAAGAEASIHQVQGAGHGFTTPASAWPDAEKAMFDWLTARGIGK